MPVANSVSVITDDINGAEDVVVELDNIENLVATMIAQQNVIQEHFMTMTAEDNPIEIITITMAEISYPIKNTEVIDEQQNPLTSLMIIETEPNTFSDNATAPDLIVEVLVEATEVMNSKTETKMNETDQSNILGKDKDLINELNLNENPATSTHFKIYTPSEDTINMEKTQTVIDEVVNAETGEENPIVDIFTSTVDIEGN